MKPTFAFAIAALLLSSSTSALSLPSQSLQRRGSHATRPSNNYQGESNFGNEFDDVNYQQPSEEYSSRGGRNPYEDEEYGGAQNADAYAPYGAPAPAVEDYAGADQNYAGKAPTDEYAGKAPTNDYAGKAPTSTTCTSSLAAYPTRTTSCTSSVLPTSTTTCTTSGKVLPTSTVPYNPEGVENNSENMPKCTPTTVTTTEVMPTTVYRTNVKTATAYKTNVITTTVEKPVPQYLTKTLTVDHTSVVTKVATKTVDNYVTSTVTTTSCTTKTQTATVTSTSTTTCYHTTTSVVEKTKTEVATKVVTSIVKETAYSTVTKENTVTMTVGALPSSETKPSALPDKNAGYGPVPPPAAPLPDKNAGYGPVPSYDSGAAPAQDTKPAYTPSNDQSAYAPTGDNGY